jgi:hypothetical protein
MKKSHPLLGWDFASKDDIGKDLEGQIQAEGAE